MEAQLLSFHRFLAGNVTIHVTVLDLFNQDGYSLDTPKDNLIVCPFAGLQLLPFLEGDPPVGIGK